MSVWSWGANSHGQLGQNVVSEQIDKPIVVQASPWKNIVQISCGGGHSLLIDDEGKLFACGWNHKLQLAVDKECSTFERVWKLSGMVFVKVACGWDFSCGVTKDNFLFVWGSNIYGQLGLPKKHFPENPRPFRLQVNACEVAMGLRHTAIINSKGEVWVTGSGRHGQLGLGSEVTASDRFQKVLKVGKISHIACGQNHTIGWSSEEAALYVWGDNKHGQLLLNSEKYTRIFLPQKIDIDVKQKVKKLLSGWTNAALWLEDGRLLTWGRNNYGQLGSEKPNFGNLTHVVLPGKRVIKDVALGSEHTVVLADDGTLWAWGWNEHGNTGTGPGESVLTPQPVLLETDPTQTAIERIFAGAGHNFAVTSNSDIKNRVLLESSQEKGCLSS